MKLEAEFGIVGAGPGGIALPVSQTDEASFEALSARGVLIFESGDENAIGRGRLGNYNGIASNSLPSEFITLPAQSPLRSSLDTEAGRLLKTYADDPAALSVPLAVVADFYHEVAQVLKERWDEAEGASRLLTDTRIVAAQQRETENDNAHWELTTADAVRFRVKNLILATGSAARAVPSYLNKATVITAEEIFNQSRLEELSSLYKQGEKIDIVGSSHSGLLCLAQLLEVLEVQGVELRPESINVYTNGHPIRSFYDSSELSPVVFGSRFFYRVKATGEYLKEDQVCLQTGRGHRYTGARGQAGEVGKRLNAELNNFNSPFVVHKEPQPVLSGKNAVVWAAGLEAQTVPLLDAQGEPFYPVTSRGEHRVDQSGRLFDGEGAVIPRAAAIGITGGLLPEPSLGGEALASKLGVRLHSANFYHKEVARRVLQVLS